MSNFLNDLSQMRFRKSLKEDSSNLYSMNMNMCRLFFAVDETKTIFQMASQQKMDFTVVADCIFKLWKQGLIKPVAQSKLCVDHNFSKLLKVNLHYIIGRKEIAYTCVNEELKKLDLPHDQVPVDLVPDVVTAVSSKISDPEVRREFCEYMKSALPLRTKMKKVTRWDNIQKIVNVPDATRGRTKQIIDRIIAVRSGGNPILENNVKIKLMLKGINPNSYSSDTLDDPKTIARLRKMAAAMGVDLTATRGRTKQIIDRIIAVRSGGNPTLENNVKIKLMLKGINPNSYSSDTLDDPKTIARLCKMAAAMGVDLTATRGRTKQIIDRIIAVRSGGNPTLENNVKIKLMLKGINPNSYSSDTLDDPKTIARLRKMAAAMSVDLDPQSTLKAAGYYS